MLASVPLRNEKKSSIQNCVNLNQLHLEFVGQHFQITCITKFCKPLRSINCFLSPPHPQMSNISIEFWWNYRAIFDLKLIWNWSDWYRGEMLRNQQFGCHCRFRSDIKFKISSTVNTLALFWSHSTSCSGIFGRWIFNPIVFMLYHWPTMQG